MRKHYGKCALCGKECELTFEHIPPRGAFNSLPARPVLGKELFKSEYLNDNSRMPWDTSGMQYDNQQQGMGKYSLCNNCNNNTGSWYADDYIAFVRTVDNAILNCKTDGFNGIEFKDIYPLRLIKQVLSMFCSILDSKDSQVDDIRQLVLNKTAVGLDKTKYKVCLYFTNTTLTKYSGRTVVLRGDLSYVESMAMAEITAYPLGFILYFNPTDTWEYQGIDITEFSDVHYNQKADVVFPWQLKEMNDIYPETFRSRDEIRECIRKNRNKD